MDPECWWLCCTLAAATELQAICASALSPNCWPHPDRYTISASIFIFSSLSETSEVSYITFRAPNVRTQANQQIFRLTDASIHVCKSDFVRAEKTTLRG